jgi:uncharacterized protein (TIGR00290 family)
MTMQRPRVALSWSSGKDSAWALHRLRQHNEVDVLALLTTINETFDRVAMHAVRRELLEEQAKQAGLPLFDVLIPWPCSNEDYERAMECALNELIDSFDITHVAFGDLYLEDIRAYRETKMQALKIKPLFPLWGLNTGILAKDMISAGLKAKITCVDPGKIPASLAGKTFDEDFLNDLEADIDPCGENGEFHTFVYAGPMFKQSIAIEAGEVVERENFIFADFKSADIRITK